MNMKSRNVLIVTATDLENNSIGQLFISSLTKKVTNITFHPHVQNPFFPNIKKWIPLDKISQVLTVGLSRLTLFQVLRITFYKKYVLNKNVQVIVKKIREKNISVVWLTTSTVELIWIAKELIDTGFDVRTTVWDAPEYICQNIKLPTYLKNDLMHAFESTLKGARSVSVVSHAMRNKYMQLYAVDSTIIKHGIRQTPLQYLEKDNNIIQIVFAGSLYSKMEWNSLISALDYCGWLIENRPVKLYFIGSYPISNIAKSDKIIFLGEHSFEKSLKLISTKDIGYLPYWFSKEFMIVAKTSFPGKLSAYAAAGVAIFHHAPSYTEPASFLKKYPFGITCSSLDHMEIINNIAKLVKYSRTKRCKVARENAIRYELSEEIMLERFKDFIK